MTELVKFWKKIDLSSKPYIHPHDSALTLEHCHTYIDLENYVANDFWVKKGLFHVNLIPIPYMGDLNSAKVFILTLNPGLSLSDLRAEETSPDLVEALKRNLIQKGLDSKFPFLFLNPSYLWHAGGSYWLKRFERYILEVMKKKKLSYLDSLSYISKKIAVLELVPYHSNNFQHNKLIKALESVNQMKSFIYRDLTKRVIAKDVCIICTRKCSEWDLPKHKNIVVYNGVEARGAHLSNNNAYSIISHFLQL